MKDGNGEINVSQKELWQKEVGKGFVVLANIALGSLVFGQLLELQINWIGFVIGSFAGALLISLYSF